MGAWIETDDQQRQRAYIKSHPMWVRGLKQPLGRPSKLNQRSHPMWVRGLKRSTTARTFATVRVAPYVGAWIETTEAAEAILRN